MEMVLVDMISDYSLKLYFMPIWTYTYLKTTHETFTHTVKKTPDLNWGPLDQQSNALPLSYGPTSTL